MNLALRFTLRNPFLGWQRPDMKPVQLNQHMNSSERHPSSAPSALHFWGIDHHHAATEVRESAYLDPEQIRRFQKAFAAENCGVASVVLCTCNRTEFYLEVRGGCKARSALHRSLARIGVDSRLFLSPPGQHLVGEDVTRHLYRVYAGLESMVLGEIQIRKQVKSAYQLALENHSGQRLGSLLMRAFQGAFRTGKRIHNETTFNAGHVSVAFIAVEEICLRLGSLASSHGLLIGTGKTGTIAARHLLRRGIRELTVINRSCTRAEKLASEVVAGPGQSVHVCTFADLEHALAKADVVLTATGSPTPIIDHDMVTAALSGRNGTPFYLFDMAVPRDIAPEVENLERVRVIGLDQLSGIVDENLQARRNEVPRAEHIVAEELREFTEWANTLHIGPTLQELRAVLEDIAEKELTWIRRKQPEETAEVVAKSLKVFIKRLLQRPVIQLKTAHKPPGIADDLVTYHQGRRMADQALPHVADIMN